MSDRRHKQAPKGTIRVNLAGAAAVAARKTVDVIDGDPHFALELIENSLWEIAVAGGNCAAARRALEDRYCEQVKAGLVLPTDRSLRNWKNGIYRNRYQEILTDKAKELEEVVAQGGIEFALRAQQIKLDALKQVQNRIGAVDAVEASTIVRNLGQAESAGVTQAGQIRNRPGFGDKDSRTLEQIAAALNRLGVVDLDPEEISEAEVIDDSPMQLAAAGSVSPQGQPPDGADQAQSGHAC